MSRPVKTWCGHEVPAYLEGELRYHCGDSVERLAYEYKTFLATRPAKWPGEKYKRSWDQRDDRRISQLFIGRGRKTVRIFEAILAAHGFPVGAAAKPQKPPSLRSLILRALEALKAAGGHDELVSDIERRLAPPSPTSPSRPPAGRVPDAAAARPSAWGLARD